MSVFPEQQIRDILEDTAEDYAAIQNEWFDLGPNIRRAEQDLHDVEIKELFDAAVAAILGIEAQSEKKEIESEEEAMRLIDEQIEYEQESYRWGDDT